MLNRNLKQLADLLLVQLVDKKWVNVIVNFPHHPPLIDLTINADKNGDLFISHVKTDTGALMAGEFLMELQKGYDTYSRNLAIAKKKIA